MVLFLLQEGGEVLVPGLVGQWDFYPKKIMWSIIPALCMAFSWGKKSGVSVEATLPY